ncbi:Cofilin-1 [Sciurus carolinensis]|uniref:Cofilin-1 n=1 Tax=Sciurus carolinensis TaxID=30640 RepID=A0AA41NIS4_SCICA|nr:Cofilin-1 [Sciurus carolinensis]
MKMRDSWLPEEVNGDNKAVLFCLSEDRKNSILEEGRETPVVDAGQTLDGATFVKTLPDKDCRCVLNDGPTSQGEQRGGPAVYLLGP